MRIIAGYARGRKLFAPEGMDTRPTADRVRESLFQIIHAHLDGAKVLDLFAGSGALALEALSRGATFAVINDVSTKAASAIRRNVEALKAQDVTRVLSLDYKRALAASDEKFSLVFLDPPYRLEGVYGEVMGILRAGARLMPGALIVAEHGRLTVLGQVDGFALKDTRRYGDTAVSLFEWTEGVE